MLSKCEKMMGYEVSREVCRNKKQDEVLSKPFLKGQEIIGDKDLTETERLNGCEEEEYAYSKSVAFMD